MQYSDETKMKTAKIFRSFEPQRYLIICEKIGLKPLYRETPLLVEQPLKKMLRNKT